MEDWNKCKVCGKRLKIINATHLKIHNLTVKEYKKKYDSKVSYLQRILKKIILPVIIFFKDFLKDIFMDQIKPFFNPFIDKVHRIFKHLGNLKINAIVVVGGISVASLFVILKLNHSKSPFSLPPLKPEVHVVNPDVQIPEHENIDTTKIVLHESPRPSRPEIPIESECEKIPDDIALDTAKIVFLEMPSPPPPPIVEEEAASFFVPYDDPPEPIGGFIAIQTKLVYPDTARKAGIEGTVTVQAKINERGEVIDTRILVPLGHSGCNEAAVSAIKAVRWKPARQRDKPIAVWVSIPVRFKLK